MMQSWSDFLDGLRAVTNVVPLKMSAWVPTSYST